MGNSTVRVLEAKTWTVGDTWVKAALAKTRKSYDELILLNEKSECFLRGLGLTYSAGSGQVIFKGDFNFMGKDYVGDVHGFTREYSTREPEKRIITVDDTEYNVLYSTTNLRHIIESPDISLNYPLQGSVLRVNTEGYQEIVTAGETKLVFVDVQKKQLKSGGCGCGK